MTKEQKIAASFLWKNPKIKILQLIAGAGSGKTTTLIATVSEYLQYNTSAQNICLITFTKKAAEEMKQRLHQKKIHVGFIGTMHALAYKFITKYKGFQPTILKNSNQIYRQLIDRKYKELRHLPIQFIIKGHLTQHPQIKELKKDYTYYKREKNLYDFDDLISECTKLFNQKNIHSPYSIALIDEFQDTSPSQLKFIQSMCFEKLFVVGDDWQSIYKFRGADVSISIELKKTLPKVKRLFLTKNFRSQKKIVRLGNQAIRLSDNYIKKKVTSYKKSGLKPICLILQENAHKNVSLQERWNKVAAWNQKNIIFDNTTILVRTNNEQTILQKIIPAKINIMTLHASKGLEFENVTIWGIQDKKIPHQWGDPDEEIRLLYVGITRAKKKLQFIAIEEGERHSPFLKFLTSQCKIAYI